MNISVGDKNYVRPFNQFNYHFGVLDFQKAGTGESFNVLIICSIVIDNTKFSVSNTNLKRDFLKI